MMMVIWQCYRDIMLAIVFSFVEEWRDEEKYWPTGTFFQLK